MVKWLKIFLNLNYDFCIGKGVIAQKCFELGDFLLEYAGKFFFNVMSVP